MVHKNDSSDIALAWAEFTKNGILEDVNIDPDIYDSWCRCHEYGLDPEIDITPVLLNDDHYQLLLKRKKSLITTSLPFMQRLSEFVVETDFVVFLADEQGYILELLGSETAVRKGENIHLVKGSRWIEEITGTNGIGTALKLRRSVQVSGEEHFCRQIHGWTCSAAPIFDNNRQLTGVLQMSGPANASHRHTLGMVVAAAQAIEEELQNKQQNRELVLVNNRLYNIFHTISEGIVIVNRNGLIEQVNPVAERILKTPAEDLTGLYLNEISKDDARLKEMLTKGRSFSDTEINVNYGSETIHCLASGKAIQDEDGKISGGVIILSPINKIKNLVNRFVGAHARFTFDDIIGNSPEIAEAISIAKLAAINDNNVLLQGESGTGKEVFAQAIHNGSNRRGGPFVAINCAAMPTDLLDSELFGYVEGAFTGAQKGGRPGKFELASGGTLFLDEIGDMNFSKQGTLLRAIQEKVITRIGDHRVIPVDVRIICATNRNLQEAVENGNFRQDLFYRLNVLNINLPPLRLHKEDIILLFNYFVAQISRRQGIEINYIEPELLSVLCQYSWPGNIRELENAVERMVCMSRDHVLSRKDIPREILHPHLMKSSEEVNPGRTYSTEAIIPPRLGAELDRKKKLLEEQDKREIAELILRYGGNISQVARELGVARSTVYRKMKSYDLSV